MPETASVTPPVFTLSWRVQANAPFLMKSLPPAAWANSGVRTVRGSHWQHSEEQQAAGLSFVAHRNADELSFNFPVVSTSTPSVLKESIFAAINTSWFDVDRFQICNFGLRDVV
jgi:hypothetical protein